MILKNLVRRPDEFAAFYWTGENIDEAREFILNHVGHRTITYGSITTKTSSARWSVDYSRTRAAVLVVNAMLPSSVDARIEAKHWLVVRGGEVVEVVRDYVFQNTYAPNIEPPAMPYPQEAGGPRRAETVSEDAATLGS